MVESVDFSRMNNTSTHFTPRIVLPVGATSGTSVTIEWTAPGAARGYEVRITASPQVDSELLVGDISPTTPGKSWSGGEALPKDKPLYAHVRVRHGEGWSHWSPAAPFILSPPPQPDYTVITFDLEYTRKLPNHEAWQHVHLVAALQGLVNRERPRLFIEYVHADPNIAQAITGGNVDKFWFGRLRAKNEWWEKAKIDPAKDLIDLLKKFPDAAEGLVVWDPEVPATSCVASTIAGCDKLLPVGGYEEDNSLLAQLNRDFPALKVRVDLRGKFSGEGTIPETGIPSSGSAKNDAYLWAIEKYLETGKCDPQISAYYIDAYWMKNPEPGGTWQNNTLSNHDFFIARRAFFWDLNIWKDEATVDDPKQKPGTDLETVLKIFAAASRLAKGRLIHLGGFTPWAYKYTDHPGAGGKYGGVPTEWETVRVLSRFRVYVDADALGLSAHANASVYAHYPLLPNYVQAGPPSINEMKDAGLVTAEGEVAKKQFVLYYVGDYDSAAWTNSVLSALWEDEKRGDIIMPWAVNPNLSLRAAFMFDWIYRTRTAMDHFQAGDSGAGYLNPTELFHDDANQGFPAPAPKVWQRHCDLWFSRFNLRTTGFVITGAGPRMTVEAEKMYTSFSGDGIVNHFYPEDKVRFHGTMPVFKQYSDLNHGPEKDAETMVSLFEKEAPAFLMFRAILKSPSYYRELTDTVEKLKPGQMVPVSPQVFAALARIQGKVNPPLRLTMLMSNPARFWDSPVKSFDIFARNDSGQPITVGDWKIELQDADGKILQSKNFPAEKQEKLNPHESLRHEFAKFWGGNPAAWLHITANVTGTDQKPEWITITHRPLTLLQKP